MKVLRRLTMVLVVLPVLSWQPLMAAGTNSTYSFLRSDVGARAASLAGAFVTVTDDPNSLFYNVGAVATLEKARASAGFFKELLDVNSGHLSYGRTIEGIGTFAAGILYTNYGSFTEADEAGNTGGTFGASDLALAVGYSTTLVENLHVGAAAKFIYSSIAGYSSTGLALDAGIFYHVPDTKLNIGASIRNVGAQLDAYLSSRESLPLDLAIGLSIVPRGLPLLLNAGVHRLTDPQDSFAGHFRAFTIGGEFTLSRVLQLRVGYDNARRLDLKVGTSAGLAGFSGGLGITISTYRLDYSLSSLGTVGNLHRITLNAEM